MIFLKHLLYGGFKVEVKNKTEVLQKSYKKRVSEFSERHLAKIEREGGGFIRQLNFVNRHKKKKV